MSSFPIDERRELSVQIEVPKHGDYHFEVVLNDNVFIGFIAWWQFEGLRFIEHFATHKNHRGRGYGKTILKKFISEDNEGIILEVELPHSEINKRRIEFYKKLGFKLNMHEYYQLPLRKNGAKLALMVMSYPLEVDEKEIGKFEKDFKEKCYDDYILD